MARRHELSKETFLQMAEAMGLDSKAPHMDDLYAHLQNILKGLAPLDELDLTDVEPDMIFIPTQE